MNVNFLLYDDFSIADIAGPAAVLGCMQGEFHLNYCSVSGDVINSMQGLKVWTEPLTVEKVNEILVIPGGRGARRLIYRDEPYIERLKQCVTKADTCLTVGNASGILAQTGLLFHRNVASYTGDENWKRMFTAAIKWIKEVRWVADGKFYSCKNSVSAMDMTLGMVADHIDVDAALRIAEELEYKWEMDESGYY